MAAALRKENQELKQQIQTLSVELENLKSLILVGNIILIMLPLRLEELLVLLRD